MGYFPYRSGCQVMGHILSFFTYKEELLTQFINSLSLVPANMKAHLVFES